MLDTRHSPDKGTSFFNRVLPAVVQIVVGIGGTALLAYLVDDGSTSAWPRWQQNLGSAALFVLLAIGIRPILRFSGRDERLAWLVIVIPIWVALTLFFGWWLQTLTGLSMWATFIGIHALVVAYGAWKRPWWFRMY